MKLKLFPNVIIIILTCLMWQITEGQDRYEAINSGVAWFDQNNNEVNAHGACIVKEGGKYYLFGEYKSDSANVFSGFSCYSSDDLMNWNFENIVLPRQEEGLLGPNRIGERVKVMKCPQTGEFVMFMHTDDDKYKDPRVGYATCDTIDGDYEFHGAILHEGKAIRKWDMGTFQDTDGKGYLLIHHGIIYELASDYKSIERLVTSGQKSKESPAMFKSNGVYFWLSSNLTSWERNDNFYLTATSLEGPWTDRGLFAPQGTLTWNSQCSFVLPVTNGKDSFFMYMGDRWSFPKQGSAGTQVWQPIAVDGDKMIITDFIDSWQPDLEKAVWNSLGIDYDKISLKSSSGKWEVKQDAIASNEKGALLEYQFNGTSVSIKGISNNISGYAGIVIKNSSNEVVIDTIVDFYSKYECSSLKFVSPSMPDDTYLLTLTVLGEHSSWSDKKKNQYGSTNDYVFIEGVYSSNERETAFDGKYNNPVLKGYYADPDIIYAKKTGKYYIYPTSDGFDEWSGHYFKTFSSDDLTNWRDEGVILNLRTDVSWADKKAWAPCIIEKKTDNDYKYYYYFTANGNIGVAVSDEPTGPFIDSGKPLIDTLPEGVRKGHQIDPDVFRDPQAGKYYLYWGNTYMAVAELNNDMISIKPDTTRILIPNARYYGEGAHVFYRDGKYYFSWSAFDTRKPNYHVRYVTADSPVGPIDPSQFKVLIQQDPENGLYATGHHAVIQVPGKDQWYIVYHRFCYPKGIGMGRAAGFHREVCIDEMVFDEHGNIPLVKPTLKGIVK